MHIKQLEVDNFKSFATSVTVPMLPGFTTISGPNGSGKSNFIDSILFALGLSTSRTLRAEKLFHLISTYTKKNEAFVRVTFEKDDGVDLVIARKIKKSGQTFNSIYYMNDKTCSLSDIHMELEQYNITPNSYNVIMQGDVTSIINSSPNERRKIIDEIAGVADFDRRIEQAQKELEIVETRVEKAKIFLENADQRLEQLLLERETALKYQKLKEEKNVLDSQVNTVKYCDTKKKLEAAHQSILEFTKKKKDQEAEFNKLEGSLLLVKKEYEEISQEVKEKGEGKQLEIKSQAEGVKGEKQRKLDSINYCEKQIFDNKRTIENKNNGIENAKNKKNEIVKKISDKNLSIKELEVQIEEQKAQKEKILKEVSGLSKSADEHIQALNSLRSELDQAKDSDMEIVKQKTPEEERLNTLNKELKEAREEILRIEESKKTFAQKKELLEVQTSELTRELESYKIMQQNAFNDLDKAKNESSDLSRSIQLAYKKLAQLEATKSVYQNDSRSSALESILDGKLQGVHLPVSELATVESKYTDALEVALGGRAKFVVVDDVDTATRAIEMLKTLGGRETFLPLDKIAKAPSRLNLPKAKGVIDFAINLIDFDDKYIDAFYFALSETLVVEDMQSARPLMGRYRVVTLEGEIFEKSGAITGGAKRRSRVKFGKTEDDELQNYKKRLSQYEDQYNALEEKKVRLEEKLEKIRSDFSNTMNERNKAKMDLDNLLRSSLEFEQKIEQRNKQINETEPLIKKINLSLEKLEEKHIGIYAKITDLNTKISEIEKRMDEGELKKLRALTEDVEMKIKTLETKVFEIKHEIVNEESAIKFNDTIILDSETTISRLLEDNKTLELDKEKCVNEIKALDITLKGLEEKIRELGETLKELQQKRDLVQNRLLESEKKKTVLESEIERTGEQVESFRARRRELEPMLEEAKAVLEEAGCDLKNLESIEITIEEINEKIQKLQRRMEALEPVNMLAITAYDEVLNHKEELEGKIETLKSEKGEITIRMQGYESEKKEAFLKTYTNINDNFKDVFNKLSDGEGTLVLENPEDPVNGGLTIEAQPRDKKKQRLESMSGGEKSLTALAFVFAIQKYMPAPFYAFDEVDMHLDTINVEKLASMIQNQALSTQFIVVSLRKPMIESANRTIGVTQKEKGITRITGVKLRE